LTIFNFRFTVVFFGLLLAVVSNLEMALFAQVHEAVEMWEKEYSLSIQDNSFLIEEAFNQEDGVIQHISTLEYISQPSRELGYSFTQEWPMWSVKHQFSYEIPYLSTGGFSGIGDIMINYRYQLFDKIDGVAIAPRVSLILPTGDEAKGLGSGITGFEINLPVSKRMAEGLVMHANVGATLLPNCKGMTSTGLEVKRSIINYTLGASGIWLFHPNVNFMLEYLAVLEGGIDPYGDLETSTAHIVNPGFRMAVNAGTLQIVPGVSVPIRFIDTERNAAVFGYLSFEHPL
jgi:hypothetical protein